MAHSVIKGLRNIKTDKIHIITTDTTENSIGKYIGDTFHVVPLPSEGTSNYIDALLKICISEKVNVLIPAHDTGLREISKHKQDFIDIGCTPIVSDYDVIKIFTDKQNTRDFFKRIGINTPESFYVKDVLKGKAKMKYPAFLKPSQGIFSFHTFIVSNKKELETLSKTIPKSFGKPLVQHFIKGREFSVDAFLDFNKKVIALVSRSRDERKQGESMKGVTLKEDRILKLAKKVAEESGIIGPCNIQCFKGDDGEIYFFEINARFPGNATHTIASGVDTPRILIKLLKGEKIKPMIGKFEENLNVYRYTSELFVDKKGKIRPGLKIR
jgi:carbamoyl-phosphate synthase large subunit